MNTVQMSALDNAVEAAGGVTALAQKISVATSAPSMGRKRGRVPAEHCPALERETGVRCEMLRPDVAWSVLRPYEPCLAKEASHG